MHIAVLPEEILAYIPPNANTMLDLTFGSGGHSRMVLNKFPELRIHACDRDTDTVNNFMNNFPERLSLFHLASNDFLREMSAKPVKADFILADLGVSSMQLNEPERGFSFMQDGPLDMRMDRSQTLTAESVVNTYSVDELKSIFYKYGEEKFSPRISAAIIKQRENEPFKTTHSLVKLIESVKPPSRHYKLHPATKVFMALRIEVNSELQHIEQTLDRIDSCLNQNGRAAFISFHSLEDRIVKNKFRELCRVCICPPEAPRCTCTRIPKYTSLTKKPIVADDREISQNPRSRSAKLRVVEKNNLELKSAKNMHSFKRQKKYE